MRNNKSYLISFASNDKWYKSQHYLNLSAKGKGIDDFISYNKHNLDKDFISRHSNLFQDGVRGYGFWMWKPMIIKQAIQYVNDGDLIFYVDSGNYILNDLTCLIDICKEEKVLLFSNRDGNYEKNVHINRHWTKRDTFVLMDCDEEKYYNAPQVDAAYQIYEKCDYTENFIEEYLKFSENENIITDLPNITLPNLPEFKDHRHDQSILSLMAAKRDIKLYTEPSEWGNYLIDRPYPQLFKHHRGII